MPAVHSKDGRWTRPTGLCTPSARSGNPLKHFLTCSIVAGESVARGTRRRIGLPQPSDLWKPACMCSGPGKRNSVLAVFFGVFICCGGHTAHPARFSVAQEDFNAGATKPPACKLKIPHQRTTLLKPVYRKVGSPANCKSLCGWVAVSSCIMLASLGVSHTTVAGWCSWCWLLPTNVFLQERCTNEGKSFSRL